MNEFGENVTRERTNKRRELIREREVILEEDENEELSNFMEE